MYGTVRLVTGNVEGSRSLLPDMGVLWTNGAMRRTETRRRCQLETCDSQTATQSEERQRKQEA